MSELSSRPLLDTGLDRPLFVDREDELEALRRSVESDLNALLLADRGAGKTSLLHRLASVLDHDRFQPVFLDGTRAASGAMDLLALIVFAIEPDRAQSIAFHEALAQTIMSGSLGEAERHKMQGALAAARSRIAPTNESERLIRALREVEDVLRRRKHRVVLLIDEPPSAEDAYQLFGLLRDELWRLPATWVLAGEAEDEATYLRGPASAFFETVVHLDPLSAESAAELLARRTPEVKLSKALRDELIAQAEGNPRRLVSLAREAILAGKRPEQISAERRERERRQSQLGEAARRLLAELEANGPASASDERLLARMGWTRSRATQVFSELERAGAVRSSLERSGSARPRKVFEIAYDAGVGGRQ